MQLSETAAIVTGGASGLGARTAAALAAQGTVVHVFDLSASVEAARATGAPRSVNLLEVDVTDAEAVRRAVATASGGEYPLRLVVNCAGIAPSERIVSTRGVHDVDRYAKVVAVNLVGAFNVMALAAERIAATAPDSHGQRGVIINTASIAAYDGQVGQAAYASSKGGIVGLTLPAARDLAQYGIRVMTIAPGIMMTPMMETVSSGYRDVLASGVPFPGRLGDAEEYAKLVLSIVENDYLNDEVIRLDGALRMTPR